MQPLFDSWSLASPSVPARSVLYSIEPIGIGTSLVESLTSYISRLAEEHTVSVGDLVGRVLSDQANSGDPIITQAAKAVRVGGHGFRACSYALNGISERTAKWVHALETATSRCDLRFLTLLPFQNVLPGHLFRNRRAWCALCFEDWRATGQIVYEPLLWGLKVSTHCLVHARALDYTCPRCGRTLNPLGVFSRAGHCGRCGDWLGRAEAADRYPLRPDRPSGEEQAWSCAQAGDLLSKLPQVHPATARDSLRRSLAVYLAELADGNILALAEYIRCPRSILQTWLDGTTVPRLATLLRTCRFLKIPASSVFAPSGPIPMNIAAAKEAIARIGKRRVSPSRGATEIRRALLDAVHEDSPRSLSEIAQSLGYKGTERLYQANRKLCHKIAARHRESGRSHWWKRPGATRICETARLREILEQSLESLEPTSVHHIAASLGYSNDGYIQRKFPGLCSAISEKLGRAKQAHPEKVRRVLEDALLEQPAPTLACLSRRLGYSTSTVLRTHQPDLCDQLVRRRRSQVSKCRADLRRKAKAALRENPVPSVRALCDRLGITREFMDIHFPDLRRAIAEQHRRCVSAETTRRREKLLQSVRDIVVELRSQGLYPAVNRIAERLSKGSCRAWKIITWSIREVRNELVISR